MNTETAALLETHFEIAFDSPKGVQKLRELILMLAMQGKLVPQDPNDEPASELLKAIEAENQRLIKEGSIRKKNPIPEIAPDELPCRLPKSWEWVRFGQLFSVTSGNNLTKDKMQEGIIPVYGGNGITGYHNEFNTKRPTIVIGRVGYYCGSIHITPERAWITDNAFFTIYDEARLDQGFVVWLLKTINLQIDTSSTAQPVISGGKIYPIPIPLPPLAEQHRIVAKIEQLMARCDELETLRNDRNQKRTHVHTAAIDRLLTAKADGDFQTAWTFISNHFSELYSVKENVAELRKAILQLAVMGKLVPQDPTDEPASELLKAIELEKQRLVAEGKIKQIKPLIEIKPEEILYKLPKSWEWVRVIDIVDVGTGSTPSTTNFEYYNGEIPWYTSSSTNNIMANEPEKFITEKAIKETNCKVFPSGSLIIALYGQGKTRGQISEIIIPGATNQAIAAMIFYESSKSVKPYIKYYFVKIYDEIRALAEGAAQPNLNVGKIKETLIPLPPLAEQRRIVAKVDQLMELCDRLDEQIEAAKTKQTELLNSLMAKV